MLTWLAHTCDRPGLRCGLLWVDSNRTSLFEHATMTYYYQSVSHPEKLYRAWFAL